MKLLPNTYYIVKRYLRHKSQIEQDYLCQKEGQDRVIQFYNWWESDAHSMWLHDFIVKRGLLKNSKKTIALCSVFGEKEVLDLVGTDVRIFFSGENLHNPRHAQYAGYMLEGKHPFDLALGFDYFEHNKYLRFPLWLTYMFAPDATEENIRKKCAELRYPQVGKREKFAALIARADWNGVRGNLADEMSQYGQIDYPSAFRHNDDSLKDQFDDDKRAYLHQYRFNICPENTNAMGYVTEKLFESIEAGCVPVYWGSYTNPEPQVLNRDAIVWNIDRSILTQNEQLAHLPRLADGAEDWIIEAFNQLENKIKSLL